MNGLSENNDCELVIVPHNLMYKFQPFDISINQLAKKFISSKFNGWYADRVSKQLLNGVLPGDVKVSFKLRHLKPLHARRIVKTYNHMKHQNDSIIKGLDAAGSARLSHGKMMSSHEQKILSMNRDSNRNFSSFFASFYENLTLFDLLNQFTFLILPNISPIVPFLATGSALKVLTT